MVASDSALDLALLRIETDLYGRPLEDGLRFPTVELHDAWPPQLGTALWVLGYPLTGGTGTRASITCMFSSHFSHMSDIGSLSTATRVPPFPLCHFDTNSPSTRLIRS